MKKEELEALERILHYASSYKNGDDWQLINNWLNSHK